MLISTISRVMLQNTAGIRFRNLCIPKLKPKQKILKASNYAINRIITPSYELRLMDGLPRMYWRSSSFCCREKQYLLKIQVFEVKKFHSDKQQGRVQQEFLKTIWYGNVTEYN